MSHVAFTTKQVAAAAGITIRHLQRVLKTGVVPGSTVTDGGHWRIPDSKELRKWCLDFQRWEGAQPAPAKRRKAPKKPPVIVATLPQCSSVADSAKRTLKAVEMARRAITTAHAESVRLGLMLWKKSETCKGTSWSAWLAETGLDHREARKLMNLAKMKRQRVDHRMLGKLGIVDSYKSGGGNAKVAKVGSDWVRKASGVVGWFNKTTRDLPVGKWPRHERDAVADQLRPIAEIVAALDRGK